MKYKVSDLAKILGVTTMTIRRYEKNGYITPERDDSDYRWYTQRDIIKLAQIRLFRKCGFSHNEIEEMLGNTSDNITDIARGKLSEIDKEIVRQKNMRHWLKDNIKMMETLKNMGDGFILMDCPPVRYVLYSDGDKLLTEKDRLKTIEDFMYTSEEVQHIYMYKQEESKKNLYIRHQGWAIKEMDIERLNLYDIMENDKFIEIYPKQKCLYFALSFPCDKFDDANAKEYIAQVKERAEKYTSENGFVICGDTMVFAVNSVGNTADELVCLPVKNK